MRRGLFWIFVFWAIFIVAAYSAFAQRVVAPLTGTVNTGTWVTGQRLNVAAMPHGFINYDYLLPQGYDPNGTTIYPIFVIEHTNGSGTAGGTTYPNIAIEPFDLGTSGSSSFDYAFNNVTWRRAYPAIVLVPYADQTDGTGGTGQNFGGYNDTTDSGGNEQGVVAMVKDVTKNFKVDPTRVYISGWSLGGHGSLAGMLDNNTVSGPGASGRVFTAGLSMAGQVYRPNEPPITASLDRMKTVPLMAISGKNDTTSPPAQFNEPAWAYYAGNTTYPSETTLSTKGVAGLQAGTSNYYFLEDTRFGHGDSYSTYGATSAGYPLYDWLFAQNSSFYVSGGKLHNPDSTEFIPHGINLSDTQMGVVVANNSATPLKTLFPGINMVRVANGGCDAPSVFNTFIDQVTSQKIVVLIEHHPFPIPNALTGSALTTENACYTAWANAWKNNPYVFLASMNEPQNGGPGGTADVTAQEVASYNAVRATGNNNPFLLELVGGGNPGTIGTVGGMSAAPYANMTNVVWDMHFYPWMINNLLGSYTTDETQIKALILGSATTSHGTLAAQTITSKDGIIPVIIGESGPSEDGTNTHPDSVQSVDAVGTSGYGFLFWAWAPDTANNLTTNNNATTTYGAQVAALIATAPVVTNESPNNSIVTTVGPTLVDAIGTVFSIGPAPTSALLAGGVAVSFTANVVEIAYVNHVIWQLNTGGDWYSMADSGGNITTASGPVKTSPLPAVPESFTFDTIPAEVAGKSFTVSGGIAGLTTAPTLQYSVNGGPWLALPGGTAAGTRLYYNQGGTNKDVWNTPIGNQATHSNDGDADQADARNGGFVNDSTNFGGSVWVSQSANDPIETFTGNGADYGADGSNAPGTLHSVSAHVVVGSSSPGPYPGDNQYSFIDNVTPANIGKYNQLGTAIQNLQAGQGPWGTFQGTFMFIEDALSDNFGNCWENKNANGTQAVGLIRGVDLDPAVNPARMPAPDNALTAIQHTFRYAHGIKHTKANAAGISTGNINGPLEGHSWPQYYQDYQNTNQAYSGSMLYGSQLYIPMSTAMPTGLSDAGKQAFWTLQHYGSIQRDTGFDSGYTLFVDQQSNATAWASQLDNDMGKLVQLLVVMRNQHVGGSTDFTDVNGPGNRVDVGPPQLSGTASVGGTVTAVRFTFTAPGMSIAPTNTISIRDANATTVVATSNTFTVGGSVSVRNVYQQPGGDQSAYNTPFGTAATWTTAADARTTAICGPPGTPSTACIGIINSTANFGVTAYTAATTDSIYAFSASSNGRTIAPDNAATLAASLHVPTGAITGNSTIVLQDPTSQPNRQYVWTGLNLAVPGIQPGQGPFAGTSGEWDDLRSDSYGEDYDSGLSGINVAVGLITGCDTTAACNPFFPQIKHGLRYGVDVTQFASNSLNGSTLALNTNGWPDRLQETQTGTGNAYTGALPFGATLGIPSATVMPTGLDANCQGLFWTMQHYPLIARGKAGGGMHISVDQVADTSDYATSVRGCFPSMVGLLRVLTNQHIGGQTLTASPKNGPGSRTDTGPLSIITPPVAPVTVTWNPSDITAGLSLSADKLTVTDDSVSSSSGVRSTTSKSAGKWCVQVVLTVLGANGSVGISNASNDMTNYLGGTAAIGMYQAWDGGQQIWAGAGVVSQGTAGPSTAGDSNTIELDADANLAWFTSSAMRRAGYTWNNSTTANPETGVGGLTTAGFGGPYFLEANPSDIGTKFTANFIPSTICTASFPTWQPVLSTRHRPLLINLGQNTPHPANDNLDATGYVPVSLKGFAR